MQSPAIVGCGVDTFIVNVKYANDEGKPLQSQYLPASLSEQLTLWQEQSRIEQRKLPTPFSFNGAPLLMMLGGAPSWKWILRNRWLEVKVGCRLHMSAVAKARLSSDYLWARASLDDALTDLSTFLKQVFGDNLYLQAGQIDLCADVVGLTLPTEWEEVFISDAKVKRSIGPSSKDQPYYRGRELETILFSGHGNPVSCKLYHKVKEIEQHAPQKKWFYDLWKQHGWDEHATVWRVEFSLERPCLREMGFDNALFMLPHLGRMWTYCTQEWLRMVIPGATKNRKRWETAPVWTLIQGAFKHPRYAEADALGPLIRTRTHDANLQRAEAAIAGYATSYAAWDDEIMEEDDVSVVFKKLHDHIVDRWANQGDDFQSRMREKRTLHSITKKKHSS